VFGETQPPPYIFEGEEKISPYNKLQQTQFGKKQSNKTKLKLIGQRSSQKSLNAIEVDFNYLAIKFEVNYFA
jgi:hypothetical protein